MPITDVVRARTGHGAKERASAALADMGGSISDAIRLLMVGAGDRFALLEATPSSAVASRAVAGLEDRQAWALARIADFLADLRNEG
jgi:antitoxin component of RelBE/YafQ-DinJ toxin-antitoxin module